MIKQNMNSKTSYMLENNLAEI